MEERGVYITLLSNHWLENGLPSNQDELKELCKNPNNWDSIWEKVGKCFHTKNGKLYNKRLLKEKKKIQEWRKKSQLGGIKSGISRGKMVKPPFNHPSTKNEPSLNTSSSSSSSSLKRNNNVKDIHKEIRHEVIQYLNEKADKHYHPDAKDTIGFINGRLNDEVNPATKEDLLRVIDIKVPQWIDDIENNKYLRPATLFNASKFEAYRNERKPEDDREVLIRKHKESLEAKRY